MLKGTLTLCLVMPLLASACLSPNELATAPISVAFCDIEKQDRSLDGKVIRTKARYFSTGHDVMLFDTRCPGLMIEPEPSQMSDDSYAALMKALGEAPPVSPPIRVLEIELSGTYRARTVPLSGVFIIEKIWHVKPIADGLTACGWLCP